MRSSRLAAWSIATVSMTGLAAGFPGTVAAGESKTECGVERWNVKTLQDRPRLLPTKDTTVAQLVSLPKVTHLPQTRLPDERQVFRVTARVTLLRNEDDEDYHLVIRDTSRHHMIVEVPSAGCTRNATRLRRRQMAEVRAAAKVCKKAVIVGVLFHDFFHHQTGVAPNV